MLQSGHLGPSGRQRRAAAIVDGIATGKGQQNGDHQQEQGQQRDGNQHPFVHRDQPAAAGAAMTTRAQNSSLPGNR